ncbi:MAG: hypothetical protein COA58_01915 [Bacteroidetes bacterium]|nr:MAG: hypothetical protein COA58_01915 [Bacteroidota bacterium]
MQKSIWIFGILAGALCAVLEYLFIISVNAHSGINSFAKIAVLAICIIAGLVVTRKLLGGVISIARTLLTGILIALVRAAIMIVVFVFMYYPDGTFYEEKVQIGLEQVAASVDADESVKPADKEQEIERISANWVNQMKPQGYSVTAILMSIISGVFISILAAVFLSTNKMYQEL